MRASVTSIRTPHHDSAMQAPPCRLLALVGCMKTMCLTSGVCLDVHFLKWCKDSCSGGTMR
eukprot:9505139-Alexandrium_andersonii.AAC.1